METHKIPYSIRYDFCNLRFLKKLIFFVNKFDFFLKFNFLKILIFLRFLKNLMMMMVMMMMLMMIIIIVYCSHLL